MTDIAAVAAREAATQSRDAARVQQDNVQRDREVAARRADAQREDAPPPPPRDSGRGANIDERA
jgi:hypothetical protein